MTVDQLNNIWITTELGISSFDGKRWIHYHNIYKWLKKCGVWSVCVDVDNIKWFGTANSGIIKYDGKKLELIPNIDGLSRDAVNAIYVDRNKRIWIGTINGIRQYDGVKWLNFNDIVHGIRESVSTIVEDNDGHIWVGTNGGHVVDVKGNIWLGSLGGGVIKFGIKNRIERFSQINGLLHNNIRAIYIDKNNDKWFGTDEGLNRFNGSQWVSYVLDLIGPRSNRVLAIAIDKANNKWLGTARRGLCKFDDRTWTSYGDESGSPKNNVQSVVVDHNAEIWCGTGAGALNFDGKAWRLFTTNDGLAHDYISPVAIDSNGNKWFGTRGGDVSRFDGVKWTTFNSETTNGRIINDAVSYTHLRRRRWFRGKLGTR